MRIGYHFHVAAVFDDDGTARIPAHYAMFVESLAELAGEVVFYAFSTTGDGTETARLAGPRIRCVDLGRRHNDAFSGVAPRWYGRRFRPQHDDLDGMIIRCPTPLVGVAVDRCRRNGIPVLPMLVADMRNWKPNRGMPAWRNFLIARVIDLSFRRVKRVIRTVPTAANASSIYSGLEVAEANLVFTSTFSEDDVATYGQPRNAWPAGLGTAEPARLLFTGRFAEQKGLFELVDALATLRDRGRAVELELVGYSDGTATLDNIFRHAEQAGVRDRIILTGFVPAGPELLEVYRRAHLYVLPTHGEGLARTVKEAALTRTPLVTTAIPSNLEVLQDGVNALLVPPFDAVALADAIERAVDDERATRARAENAFDWASAFTNERSAAMVLEVLRRVSGR